MFWLGPQDTVDRSATDADLPMSVLGASLATPPYEIGPAPSFYDTIRQQPSADLVQKHDPGSGYGAKKGLTAEGPAESSSMREKGKRPWYPEPAHSCRSI
jgi:hypothetical protein